ncbi:MAG: bifunctional phosphopantothenoylcysteine decarboxylase/phosphopantothenate--cysteine ligase CoaBC [Polyangiaceae bacterium]
MISVSPNTPRKTVALCVSASIAAYKSAEIARGLLEHGLRVLPVMTARASEFLGPATLSGLTGEPVRTDMWDSSFAGEMHVSLARDCDLVIIAPATADLLARMASGRADDLVTALSLVFRGTIVVAPAMHPAMWDHPATRRNVEHLARDGRVTLVGPVDGPVASGESGIGRMASPADIVDASLAAMSPKDLDQRHVVITAGPTVEDIDPVRFLTNRSSGTMGFAVARRAAWRGARVTLIAGPTSLPTPPTVRRVDVRSALDMQAALKSALVDADALVMSAAVSDFRPATRHANKHKRDRSGAAPALELVQNPDLLAEVGAQRTGRRPVLVGFAVETDSDDGMIAQARKKLAEKRVDLVVVNHAAESLGRPDNRAILVDAHRADPLPPMSKAELADRILDRVHSLIG